jgi:hypothetical protein
VLAFKAHLINITVSANGDATATLSYSLEGIIENSIPDSMLQTELSKGLATSSDPPTVVSFDHNGATLILHKFAQVNDVKSGTEYMTVPMDFKKADVALKNSDLSYVISADFTPQISTVTFPDGFTVDFTYISTLPSIQHVILNQPSQIKNLSALPQKGSITITSSPVNAQVFIDDQYVGNSPAVFAGITPGNHTVRLECDLCEPSINQVMVSGGSNESRSIILIYKTPTSFITTSTPKRSIFSLAIPGFEAVYAFLALTGFCIVLQIRRRL